MAVPAFMARDFVAQPINENPASAPVVPAFGGDSPATYTSTYVPSFATRWVEALQSAMTALMGEIQATLNEADGRLGDLEDNVAGYQTASEVQTAINNSAPDLTPYALSSQVALDISNATADMATNVSVANDISTALASYDDASAVDVKIANAKSELIGGAGPAFDTLLELKTAYENADVGLTSLINDKANSTDLADAVARIGALEQLVNDLHSSTYGQ